MNSLNQLIQPDVLQAILASQAVNLNLNLANWQHSSIEQLFPGLFAQNPTIFTPTPQYFPTGIQFDETIVKNEPISEPVEPLEPVEPTEPSEPDIKFEMGQLPTSTYYPTHFMRGTQLHVANGTVKRVEDLSSDDFLRCAAESSDVVVNASVVKAIQKTSPGCVQILFETGNGRDRIPLKCQIEHPFFVLGKGWSSCSPRKSGENYGLDCGQLEVNDVCVVLTRKEPEQVAVDIVTAERDLEKYGQMAKRREDVAEAYYQYVGTGRNSAPPERIFMNSMIRQRRTSE